MIQEIWQIDDGEGISQNHEGNGWRVKEKERRLSLYHQVVHCLAFIIVCPYVIMVPISMVLNFEIPVAYSTIVSIVIGFYFARSLL